MKTLKEFKAACLHRWDSRDITEPGRPFLDIAVEVYKRCRTEHEHEIAILKAAHEEEIARLRAEHGADVAHVFGSMKAEHEARVGELQCQVNAARRSHADTMRAADWVLADRDEAWAEVEKLRHSATVLREDRERVLQQRNNFLARREQERKRIDRIVVQAQQDRQRAIVELQDAQAENERLKGDRPIRNDSYVGGLVAQRDRAVLELERLKGERDEAVEELAHKTKQEEYSFKESVSTGEENAQLRERLVLADQLAEAWSEYAIRQNQDAWEKVSDARRAYLSSREGAGAAGQYDSSCPGCTSLGHKCVACLSKATPSGDPGEAEKVRRALDSTVVFGDAGLNDTPYVSDTPTQPPESPARQPDPRCTCGAGYPELCHPKCLALTPPHDHARALAEALRILLGTANRASGCVCRSCSALDALAAYDRERGAEVSPDRKELL